MDAPHLTPEQIQSVYNWVDQIPLSRSKKNISRDFADGVLVAQIIAHFFPKLIQLHNYIASGSAAQKLTNWNMLNNKVLKKMNIQISKNDIQQIISASPDVVQRVLFILQTKVKSNLNKKKEQIITITSNKMKEQNLKNMMENKDLKFIMSQKQSNIKQLKETIQILELKLKKMDNLVKVKDHKIQSLINKLKQLGIQ